LRAWSLIFAPAACSPSTAMICSAVKRFRFICPSFYQGRILIQVEETLSGRSLGSEKPCVLTARPCAAKQLWSRKFSTLANIEMC
jgi:hypothetical protein